MRRTGLVALCASACVVLLSPQPNAATASQAVIQANDATGGAWSLRSQPGARLLASNNSKYSDSASAESSDAYSGTPIALPGTIAAADFDDGGEGVGYHDTTS